MKRALLCTLIAAALLLSACTRASESTVRAPDAGAPLTLCLGAGPAALDPARTENGVGATYVVNLFAGLTGYRAGGDGKAELTPELCAALPEPESLPDGRVQYVFTLRDGLTWSDGTPLTAADFVYAWNRASTLSDAAAPYLFACIDGYGTGRLNVTASADGRTLTVVLAEAMPTFLQLCAQPAYAPVPSGAADTTSWTADGAAFVTSGPYTVAAWTTESLTYTKNPAYWDADNVAAETVRFVFQSDASAAASARAGEIKPAIPHIFQHPFPAVQPAVTVLYTRLAGILPRTVVKSCQNNTERGREYDTGAEHSGGPQGKGVYAGAAG